jgi:solute carrier family 39 (zinc transporter), member 1/2/3
VSSIASPTLSGGEGQARSTRSAQLLGWVGWVASVVVMSVVVSFVRDGLPSLSHPADRPNASPAPASVAVEPTPLRLARRQTACGVGGAQADYNMPLHVGAVFIVLGVSGGACAFPLLASRFPFMRIHPGFLFAIRHFGTGVLLATAFVHLLPTAFISLGDPCLSNFWTTDYPPMPGAIALVGIFLVTIIEMVFSPARFFTPKTGRATENADAELRVKEEGRPVRLSVAGHCGHPDVAAAVTRPAQPQSRVSIEVASPRNSGDADPRSSSESMAEVEHGHVLTPEQQHKKSILQCMMLEVGILFHSVFIGMALSVAVGGDFIVLLIAIAFHRTSLEEVSPCTSNMSTDLLAQKRLKAWPWAPASQPSRGPRARCSRG